MAGVMETRVKDLLSTSVVTIDVGSTVQEALDLLLENRLHAVPVIAPNETCVGMLSLVDLLEAASEAEHALEEAGEDIAAQYHAAALVREALGSERIEAVMSDSVISIGPDASLDEAGRAMLQGHIHHLPVLDEQQKLLGIVSTLDIIRKLLA